MVTTPSREKKDRGRHWQRAATRGAILAAARRLAERGEDIERLSLTSVAREADFAPTTVFAYFANRNDLFLAVLADDLARFAATMREVSVSRQASEEGTHEADEPRVAPTVDMLPSPEQARAMLRLVEQAEVPAPANTTLAPSLPAPTTNEAPVEENNAAFDAVALELAQLREAVTRLETRPPVDQWLERRLREFERGLAALEPRPEKAETASATAAVEESVRILVARVEGVETRQAQAANEVTRLVRERSEQVERRLREELSEIEARHARDRGRIDALENVAFAAAPEFFAAKTEVAPAAVPDAATADVVRQSNAQPATQQDDAPKPAPTDGSFLAAARRSALAAQEQRNNQPQHLAARTHRLTKRTLYAIAAGLGLVVVLIWTGVYLRAMAVTATPAAAATRPSVHRSVVAVRYRTPVRHMADARSELVSALKLLDGTPKNEGEAAKFLSDAAQQGDAFAAFKLATLYRDGRGVPADKSKAFRWFETAAAKGNLKAMQSLAVAYAEGWGTARDSEEAARWFTHAASSGLTDAQFNLGVLYERGLGVPQSLTDAYKWYLVAAAQGDEESRSRVEALKSQLGASDLAAAEEAAASFKPLPVDSNANLAPATSQSPAG